MFSSPSPLPISSPLPPLPQSTGIIVIIMLVASCLCCCSYIALFSPGCPKLMKKCGCVILIIAFIFVSIYIAWVALGTYFVILIDGTEAICRNTIMYLVLLYVYLIVLVIAFAIFLVWKCYDLRVESRAHSGTYRKTRTTKK